MKLCIFMFIFCTNWIISESYKHINKDKNEDNSLVLVRIKSDDEAKELKVYN